MTQEWHEWRSQGIGASDAAVIMKKFPYGKTPLNLWEEKIGGSSTFTNKAMEHGNKMEPRALKWAQDQLGIELIGQNRSEHPQMPWMRATLDGVNFEKRIMVEIKCPYNLENHYKVKKTQEVPEIYFPQLQHQIKVEEERVDKGYLLSFNHKDENDSILIEVKRDNQYIEKLVDEEYEFFQHVVNRTPPPLTDLDYDKKGEDWIKVAKERKELKDLMSHLEKKDKELYKSLIDLSGGKNSSGAQFKFTKIIEKGRVDYDAAIEHYVNTLRALCAGIVELPSIDLDSFRKSPVVKWRLT
jgi:putative phage-type endonuclease